MSKQAIEGASRMNAFAVDPALLIIVGLDTDDGPEHPLWDERAKLPVDEALVRNMMATGFRFGAIAVVKDGDRLLVGVGRQRVKAAREANTRLVSEGKQPILVRCMVERIPDDADKLGMLISENELRQDNTPLQRAKLVGRYLSYRQDEKAAATVFGVSTQTIRNYQKLLDLAPEVQKAIEESRIKASAAIRLADLPRAEQVAALQELPQDAGTRDVTKAAARKKGQRDTTRPGIKDIRAVIENEKLPPEVEHALRWVLGEVETAVKP